MSFCGFPDEQLPEIKRKLRNSIFKTVKSVGLSNPESFLKYVYNNFLNNGVNPQYALFYTINTPEALISLLSEPRIAGVVAPHASKLIELRDQLAKEPDAITKILSIGVKKEEVISKEKPESPSVQVVVGRKIVKNPISRRPSNLFTTTGRQLDPSDPKYKVINNILNIVEASNNDSTETNVVPGGIYLTMSMLSEIPGYDMPAGEVDRLVNVLTDDAGTPIYFNANNEIVDISEPSARIEFFEVRSKDDSKRQPLSEFANSIKKDKPYLTDEEALAEAKQIYDIDNEVFDLIDTYIKNYQGARVKSKITGGSRGLKNFTKTKTYFSSINENYNPTIPDALGKVFITVPYMDEPVEVLTQPLSDEKINNIATIITNPVFIDGREVSTLEIIQLLQSYLISRKTGISYEDMTDTEITINGTVYNRFDPATREVLLNRLKGQFPSKEVNVKQYSKLPIFDSYDDTTFLPTLNPKVNQALDPAAKANHLSLFTGDGYLFFDAKMASNLDLKTDQSMLFNLDGINYVLTRTGEKAMVIKEYTGDGLLLKDGKYLLLVKEIQNLNSKLVADPSSIINDFTLAQDGGKTVLVSNMMPYRQWMKNNTYTRLEVKDGRLVALNGYLSFTPLAEEIEAIREPEAVKEAPIELNIDALKNDLDALRDIKFKTKNQKALNDTYSPEELETKIKNAEVWAKTKQIKVRKIDPNTGEAKVITTTFNSLWPVTEAFNAINKSNPNAVASWTSNAITLYKGSDYTDVYHEAWHGFEESFLSEAQKNELHAEVRKLNPNIADISEYLAEDFRKFALSGGKREVKGKVRKSTFQKIWDFLSALFSGTNVEDVLQDPYTIPLVKEMYDNLYVGDLSQYNFRQANSALVYNKTVESVGLEKKEELSYEDSEVLVKSINSIIASLITQYNLMDNTKKFSSVMFSNRDSLKILFNAVKRELNANAALLRNEIQTKYTGVENLSVDQIRELQKLNYQAELLQWAVDNFGDNTENILLSTKGVVPYYIEKSTFLSDDEKIALQDTDVSQNFDKRGNEASLSQMATPEINRIMLFINEYDASGKIVKNELGFNELDSLGNNWYDFANLLENNLGIDDILTRLQEAAKQNTRTGAKAKQLLSYFGNTDSADAYEQQMLSMLQRAFNITNIQLIRTNLAVRTEDGETKFETVVAPSGRNVYQTKRRLDDAFYLESGHPYILIDNEGRYLNKKALKTKYPSIKELEAGLKNNPFEVLYNFGVILTDNKEVRNALKSSTKLQQSLKYALNKVLSTEREKDIIRYISDKNISSALFKDEFTSYNEIAKIENDYSGKNTSFMVLTAENTAQYVHSQNMSLSMMVNATNAVNSLSTLQSLPYMSVIDANRNPMLINHTWLSSLFDETGNKRANNSLLLENLSGTRLLNENDVFLTGIESFSADNYTRMFSDIEVFMQTGFTSTLQAADKGSTYRTGPKNLYVDINKTTGTVFTNKFYIHPARFLSNTENTDLSWKINLREIMMSKVQNEIRRIIRMKNINNDPNPTAFPEYNAIIGDKRYSEAGAEFIDFKDVLSSSVKQKIIKLIDDKVLTEANLNTYFATQNTDLNSKIADSILNYFNTKLDTFYSALSPYSNAVSLKTATIDFNKMSKDSFKGQIKQLDKGANIKAIIKAFYINQWIHNYETINYFHGSLLNFNHEKSEFFKRNPGIQSTGDFSRTDAGFETYINDHKKVFESYINSQAFTGNKPEVMPRFESMYNSAIVEDIIVQSLYYEEMFKAKVKEAIKLGVSEEEANIRAKRDLKNYLEMTEADAQGYISFPALRVLMEGMGKWTGQHQRIYDSILSGKYVDTKTFNYFFPTLKMQMYGPLATKTGLPMWGFHKFSLTPLNPAIIKGKKLEAFHNRMVEQNIHYATFVSGSKMVSLTSNVENGKPALDKFYDKTTTQLSALDPNYKFTVNPVYPQYFKHQLETGSEFKGKATLSTQLKKLIPLGLMENGVPVGYKGSIEAWKQLSETEKGKYKNYVLYKNYLKVLTKLADRLEKELAEEFGFSIETKDGVKSYTVKDNNFQKLVEKLRKHLDNKGLPNHIINYIAAKTDGSGIERDLSGSLLAEEIENAIASLIMKRLVKPKLNGEALIQVSTSGYEPTNLERSGFRKPTEEEYEKYKGTQGTNDLPYYYPGANGLTKACKVKVAMNSKFKKLLLLPEVIKYAEENNVDRLKALNAIIRDDKQLDKNNLRAMITMIGVRIPVQGFAQMDFMEVYEFLPESAGNIIILPSEIVAKSGGDFDIDKLTILLPSFRLEKGVPVMVEDVEIKESIDELTKEKDRLFEALEKLDEEFDEQLKNFSYVFTPEDKAKVKAFHKEYNTARKALQKKYLDTKDQDELDVIEASIMDLVSDFIVTKKKFVKSLVTESNDYTAIMNQWTVARTPIINEIEAVRKKMDQYSYKGIQNNLIAQMRSILEQPDSYTKLITPNDTYYTQPLATDEVTGLENFVMGNFNAKDTVYPENRVKKGIVPTKVIEPDVNYLTREVNSVSKETLGIGAKSNVANVNFNSVGLYLEAEGFSASGKTSYLQQLKMDHNTKIIDGKKVISLSELFDAKFERNIAEQISQLMNGWVDVAKNPYIYYLQGNKKVSPVILFLVQAGVDLKTAIYFVSQPLIREYTRAKDTISGPYARTFITNPDYIPNNVSEINSKALRYLLNRNNNREYFEDTFEIDTRNFRYNYWLLLSGQGNKMLEDETIDWDTMFDNDNLFQTIKDTATQRGENEDNWKSGFSEDEALDKMTDQFRFLMHYMQIQEMAEAIRKLSASTDFDVINISSAFDQYNRKIKIAKLLENSRLPIGPVTELVENSPASPFNADEAFNGITDPLFKLRKSPVMVDFVVGKMQQDRIYSVLDRTYFFDLEDYVRNFLNDFQLFIFQNTLLHANEGVKEYKSRAVSYDIEIKDAPYLKFGAFVKDNVLYVNKAKLTIDFNTRAYTKSANYQFVGQKEVDGEVVNAQLQLATVPSDYFSSAEEYTKFVMEREVLRSIYPNKESIATDIDYKIIVDDLLSREFSLVDAESMGYEMFLRNKALENTFNLNYLFYSKYALANKLNYIQKNYPELAAKYNVLDAIESNWSPGGRNIKEGDRIKNIILKETGMDQDTKNKYHDNILKLSDPTVIKVNDPAANRFISQTFSMLPIFAYLQSGTNNSTRYSLMNIVPSESIDKILEKPMQYYTKNLTPQILEVYFNEFNTVNNSRSVDTKDRLRDYRIFNQSRVAILRGSKVSPQEALPKIIKQPVINQDNVNLFSFVPSAPMELTNEIGAAKNELYVVNSSFVATSRKRPEGEWDNELTDSRNWRGGIKNLAGIRTIRGLTAAEVQAGIKAKMDTKTTTQPVDNKKLIEDLFTKVGGKKTSKGLLQVDGQHWYMDTNYWTIIPKDGRDELFFYPNKDTEIYIGERPTGTKNFISYKNIDTRSFTEIAATQPTEIKPLGNIVLNIIEDWVQTGQATTTVRSSKYHKSFYKGDGVYTSDKGNLVNITFKGIVKLEGDNIVGDNVFYTKEQFAKAEGFGTWNNFVKNAKYAGQTLVKGGSVYLYEIKPAAKPTVEVAEVKPSAQLPDYSYKIATSEALEKAKAVIDEDINNLVSKKNSGTTINLSPEGYGTYLKDSPNAYNRELFTHISKRLFESFGYVNPGYYLSAEQIEKTQAPVQVTDQDVTDYIIKCLIG